MKLANVEALAAAAPSVRRIVTGNAAVNTPMIAVNDMMGFEIAGAGWFWQKDCGPPEVPPAAHRQSHEYAENMYTDAMKAGIVGASGYTGPSCCGCWPGIRTSRWPSSRRIRTPARSVGGHTPSLAAAYPGLVYEESDPDRLDGLDVVFCALPHGESQRIVPELRGRVGLIVDLAADFRLRDARSTRAGTARSTRRPSSWPRPSTGCPSCSATSWPGPRWSPPPGATRRRPAWPWPRWCGPGWSSRPGSSSTPPRASRGRDAATKESLHFGTVDEDFIAYGLLTHRHTPEMEQILGAEVLFTPHLAPMVRGILATCYARPADRPRRSSHRRRSWTCCTRPTTTSRSWW